MWRASVLHIINLLKIKIMASFIELPKNVTGSSFDLLNVSNPVREITSPSSTTLKISFFNLNDDGDNEPSATITVDSTMDAAPRNTMINNLWAAVEKTTSQPNSVPTLTMVGSVLVDSLLITHA